MSYPFTSFGEDKKHFAPSLPPLVLLKTQMYTQQIFSKSELIYSLMSVVFINRIFSQHKMLPFTSMSKEKEEEEVDEVESRTTPSSIVEDCSTVCFVDNLSDFISSFHSLFCVYFHVCLSLLFLKPIICVSI